jgi:hypothetical protein
MITPTIKPVSNPYSAASDADCHALWEILVARDSQSFAEANWSICDEDFAHDRFEGISAHGSFDPMKWTLRYPTVESYRDDWLGMARQFLSLPFKNVAHYDLLMRMQKFSKTEIAADRAIVWKQFRADEPLAGGESYRIAAQSVYRLHRLAGRWKIVGFVGYLPLGDSETP